MIGFVLSCGRSGSTSIHQYLKIAENTIVLHEPLGTQALRDAISQGRLEGWPVSRRHVFEWCRKEGIDHAISGGKNFIECTPILSGLAGAIVEVYPQAKFLWVMRDDPRFWIRSALHVGFQFCSFPKVCRYFAIENGDILDGWKRIPRENRAVIRSSEIRALAPRIYDWFECEPHTNEARTWLNQNLAGHKYLGPKWVPHPDDWTEEQYVPYNREVKPIQELMEKRYGRDALKDK